MACLVKLCACLVSPSACQAAAGHSDELVVPGGELAAQQFISVLLQVTLPHLLVVHVLLATLLVWCVRVPATLPPGTADEMVVPGGELAFLRAMLRDSQQLRGRIHWYSSMCGKKATLKVLRQELHSAGGCGQEGCRVGGVKKGLGCTNAHPGLHKNCGLEV